MNNLEINTIDKIEYLHIISDMFSNPKVQQMANYRQHYDTSCLKHCLEVSYISYKICKKLHLDYVSAARAGLLHDLFLYDWRDSKKQQNLQSYHAFSHPKVALQNATELFNLNKKEQDIILKHMWPVTLFHFPRYIESFIITLVDKQSALISFREYYSSKLERKTFYKYIYVFLALLVFNI